MIWRACAATWSDRAYRHVPLFHQLVAPKPPFRVVTCVDSVVSEQQGEWFGRRRVVRAKASGSGGSVQALVDDGHALAAADAHGLEAELPVASGQAVEQCRGDAGTGGAERVAQGYRATVDVESVGVDAQVVHRRQHLHGERLVDLDQVHVCLLYTSPSPRD